MDGTSTNEPDFRIRDSCRNVGPKTRFIEGGWNSSTCKRWNNTSYLFRRPFKGLITPFIRGPILYVSFYLGFWVCSTILCVSYGLYEAGGTRWSGICKTHKMWLVLLREDGMKHYLMLGSFIIHSFFSGPSCCKTKQDVHVELLLVGSEGTVGLKGAIWDTVSKIPICIIWRDELSFFPETFGGEDLHPYQQWLVYPVVIKTLQGNPEPERILLFLSCVFAETVLRNRKNNYTPED